MNAASELSHFRAAIERLGANDEERAAALGITSRQLRTWRNQGFPIIIKRLVRTPDLVYALAKDTEIGGKIEHPSD